MDIIKDINKNSTAIWAILPKLSVKELEEIIKLSLDSYYNSGISLVTDEVYDILITKLESSKPDSSVLKKIGFSIKGKKVKLPYWLGSMNKIKTDEKVLNSWLVDHKGPYLVSDKLDGVSCLVTIHDKVIKMYTRGDGENGQNISHLLKLIGTKIPLIDGENLAIRGELIMSKKNFEQFSGEMANARNMVSGIVNSKPTSVNKTYASNVNFIAYEIITPPVKGDTDDCDNNQEVPQYPPSKQLAKLEEWGFDVVKHKIYHSIDIVKLSNILKTNKSESIYEIDGIIVTNDKPYTRNVTGNPTYSFAFKGQSMAINTKVIDVIWKPAKDGYIIPRIHFEKIHLCGVEIEYTAGFSAKFITDNLIGPGAIITIIRSGDTIPYIIDVVTPVKKLSLPTNLEYEWDGANIILINPDDNQDVKISRITKFVRDLGVENMSEGIVKKLVEAGYDSIPAIMKLTKKDLLELDGFQEKLADKLIQNMDQQFKKIDLLTLMVASNVFGRGFGERKIKKILNVYPNIVEEYRVKEKDIWIDKIIDIDGFDTNTASKFIGLLDDFQDVYKTIKKIRPIKPYQPVIIKKGDFTDQNIVFTGFREKNWKSIIESQGGKVSAGVSGNTTLLIYADGDESSTSYQKAKKMGTKMMTKSAFQKKYGI